MCTFSLFALVPVAKEGGKGTWCVVTSCKAARRCGEMDGISWLIVVLHVSGIWNDFFFLGTMTPSWLTRRAVVFCSIAGFLFVDGPG